MGKREWLKEPYSKSLYDNNLHVLRNRGPASLLPFLQGAPFLPPGVGTCVPGTQQALLRPFQPPICNGLKFLPCNYHCEWLFWLFICLEVPVNQRVVSRADPGVRMGSLALSHQPARGELCLLLRGAPPMQEIPRSLWNLSNPWPGGIIIFMTFPLSICLPL